MYPKFAITKTAAMQRILLLLTVMLTLRLAVTAQAYTGKVEYQKTQQPAAFIELPYSQDVVEDGIKDYMAKKGYKGSSAKGFNVFRGTRLDTADANPSDLYFKIDRKSRKEKDITVITLVTTKANQDIMTRSRSDSAGINTEGPKNFLNNLVPYLDAHNTDVQVAGQQEVLKKAQKKLNSLKDDQVSLEKKMRKLQSEQEQNKNDLLKQTQDMQNTVQADDNVKNKAQKRMNKLLDDQDNLRKKIRNTQTDIDQNTHNIESQENELQKQQQILDAIKAKQKA